MLYYKTVVFYFLIRLSGQYNITYQQRIRKEFKKELLFLFAEKACQIVE